MQENKIKKEITVNKPTNNFARPKTTNHIPNHLQVQLQTRANRLSNAGETTTLLFSIKNLENPEIT
jgi:hypothetical protein